MDNKYSDITPLNSVEALFNVKNDVVVIIGGNGKMGQQFASVLHGAGAKVIVTDIQDNCKVPNQQYTEYRACDVNNESEIVDLFEHINTVYGRLDSMVYNVMAKPQGYYKSFTDYSKDTFEKVIQGNLTGAFIAAREATKLMKNQKKGSIVLTASTYGVVGPDQRIYESCTVDNNIYGQGDPLCAPISYTASKSGLIGVVKYLSPILGPDNIRINALVPGGVYDEQDEGFHKAYTYRTTLGRMATWTDYNGAIVYLCSEASRYMTGTQLVVDGGWTSW